MSFLTLREPAKGSQSNGPRLDFLQNTDVATKYKCLPDAAEKTP